MAEPVSEAAMLLTHRNGPWRLPLLAGGADGSAPCC
jgi:hypothetical protein